MHITEKLVFETFNQKIKNTPDETYICKVKFQKRIYLIPVFLKERIHPSYTIICIWIPNWVF